METGEEIQEKGRRAARRARDYLLNTTRVASCWVNPEAAPRLQFVWPGTATQFSFDLGGTLLGEPYHYDEFFAEVKGYEQHEGGQAGMYKRFLAQCYVAYQAQPGRCNHFMYLTWTPFRVKRLNGQYRKWSWLGTAECIQEALVEERARVFAGGLDEDAARDAIDGSIVDSVSERLWLFVLSAKQESLVITPEHRQLIYGKWNGGAP